MPFVEVSLNGVNNNQTFAWDTHAQNFAAVKGLLGVLDPAWSTLITDLKDRGLLDSTLIVWMGEFGRTPKINGDNGRDHFPDVFSALLAGGGINVGQVLGESSEDGSEIKHRPVSIPDFHATLFTAMGLDISKDYFAPDGRLLKLTESGRPITELLAS